MAGAVTPITKSPTRATVRDGISQIRHQGNREDLVVHPRGIYEHRIDTARPADPFIDSCPWITALNADNSESSHRFLNIR